MQKRITVHIYSRDNYFFPIETKFTLNKVNYSLVHEDEKDMARYFSRYYPATIKYIDKRK